MKSLILSFFLGAILLGGGFYAYQNFVPNPILPGENGTKLEMNSSGTPKTIVSEIDILSPSTGPAGTKAVFKTKKYSYCDVEPVGGCVGDRNLSVSFFGNNKWIPVQTMYSSHIDSAGYKVFEIQVPTTLTPGTYQVGVSGIGKNAYFLGNPATFTISGINTPSITVIQPNGGTVYYSNIVMAGNLLIQWEVSGETYTPSKLFKAYILDTAGVIVRDNPITASITKKSDHVFQTSFVGEKNLVKNGQYKVKVCDMLNGKEYCDTSDAFFTLN